VGLHKNSLQIRIKKMTLSAIAHLRLMNLISPALPIGGFAYSQGLEYAIDAGWINNEHALQDWLQGLLSHTLTFVDGPLLSRCYSAIIANDVSALLTWQNTLFAMRETKELQQEEMQLGAALNTLLNSLALPPFPAQTERFSYVALFAFACVLWEIDVESAISGFFWAWLQNQIAVAGKTIPLGQTRAQTLINQCMMQIPQAVQNALKVTDENIGSAPPAFAIGSALHEQQYSRLFRS
jgi:urease accessory protein